MEFSKQPFRPIVAADRGLVIRNQLFVVFSPSVTFGSAHGNADIRFYRNLRSLHATVQRTSAGYQLVAHPKCQVEVSGTNLQASHNLRHNDRVILGPRGVHFTFLQPIETSHTALLEFDLADAAALAYPAIPGISECALMDADIFIRPREPAHFVVPNLPCRQLHLSWYSSQLVANLDNGYWLHYGATQNLPRPLCFGDTLAFHGSGHLHCGDAKSGFINELLTGTPYATPQPVTNWELTNPHLIL